jgi:pimeloyl-ACP methyl ester carboxylesterase
MTRAWIPDGVPTLRGILICGNGADADGRGQADQQHKRAWARHHGFAILATGFFRRFNDGFSGEDWTVLTAAMADLVERSGHPELAQAPWLCWGHSNGGQMAYGLARLAPERVIAFVVNKGGYYIDASDGGANPVAVPGLFIAGEQDEGKNSRQQVIEALYRSGRVNGAPWAWLEERRRGHELANSQALAFAWFEQVLSQRYPPELAPTPSQAPVLRPLSIADGWLLAEGHRHWATGDAPIRAVAAGGDDRSMGWLPDRTTAMVMRASASYDPELPSAWSPLDKAVRILAPVDPLDEDAVGALLYRPGHAVEVRCAIAATIGPWRRLELYAGDQLLAETPYKGAEPVTVTVVLDPIRALSALHARLILADGTARSSAVLTMIAAETP